MELIYKNSYLYLSKCIIHYFNDDAQLLIIDRNMY